MTRAVVQACGSLPVVCDFNTLAGISSGPDALCGFRASNCFLSFFFSFHQIISKQPSK